MATLMKTHAVRKRARQPIDFENVGEELAQLKRFVCHRFELGRMAEYLLVMVPHHRSTASGRRNNVIVRSEYFEEPLGKWPRVAVQARVGHWLATAGLLVRILDDETLALQQFERRHPDLRIE